LQATLYLRAALRKQALSARFRGAKCTRPKQQQARETSNPVTGLIHQSMKCLAAGVVTYIVSVLGGCEVRWRGAKNTVNPKGQLCIQSGRNYVEE
jgi:hypothetical protein